MNKKIIIFTKSIQNSFLNSLLLARWYFFRCASTTKMIFWWEDSSCVATPHKVVPKANARSLQSFNGVKFLIAVFTWWYSGWSLQFDEARKDCETPSALNNTVDLGPKKSGMAEVMRILGSAGFFIIISPPGSCEIFWARTFNVSSGSLVSNKGKGISSSVKYPVCLFSL